LTQRYLADIAQDEGGNVEKASTGDPQRPSRPAAKAKSPKVKRKKPAKRKHS
jgi:hypothetical protein